MGDEAAGVQEGVAVLFGEGGALARAVPRGDEVFGQQAACGDEEGAGAHGRVADLEAEDLLGGAVVAEAGEDGLEGALDDFFAEPARGVVAAGAAAFLAGLQHEPPRTDAVAGLRGFAAGGELEELLGEGARVGGARHGVFGFLARAGR